MTSTHVADCALQAFRSLAVAGLLSSAAIAGAQDAQIPAFKTLDSMEARVQGCATCHGQSGQGTRNGYFPRIAGKPAGYLYNQLMAFRDGTRRYPPMNYLRRVPAGRYLREIAEHFAELRPPFGPKDAAPADAATIGARAGHREEGRAARHPRLCRRAMARA